jgi:hypothetical protein
MVVFLEVPKVMEHALECEDSEEASYYIFLRSWRFEVVDSARDVQGDEELVS